CGEGVLHPGLADLFEALGVICSTAHPVKILRDDRMIGIWQRKPIGWLVAKVTRVGSHCQANLSSGASKLLQGLHISDDDIRPGCLCWRFGAGCRAKRWHHN